MKNVYQLLVITYICNNIVDLFKNLFKDRIFAGNKNMLSPIL